MAKTNKELAVDVAIALIQANNRVVYRTSQYTSKAINSLPMDSVIGIINTTYQALENLDKNSQAPEK